MSILIKGMDMPDSCFHCKLAEVCQHYKAEHYANKRHEDCPLEEVPETHDKRTETHACDYISRDDAIAVAGKYFESDGCNGSDVAMDIQSDLLGLPSAQPIVRCKDCKYSDTDNTLGVMFCWRVSYHEASEDGFCSWAERRTDEADNRKE